MTIENLINFINHHTNNGAISAHEPWKENVEIKQEGIAFILCFSSRDWLVLHNLNLKEKSSSWLKCLIYLLHEAYTEAYTEEARQMIIHIALNGTEETFFDAMNYIRSFRRDVSTYAWLKLQNRATEILSSN